MVPRPPRRVFETPLAVTRPNDDGVVVIYAPDGRSIALTVDAAEQSAAILLRAAHETGRPEHDDKVVAFDFIRRRRVRRCDIRRTGCPPRLRVQVGTAIAPVAWALFAGMVLAVANLVTSVRWTIAALPWLVAGAAVLAAIAAYVLAPLLMTRDERRPPVVPHPRLTLA